MTHLVHEGGCLCGAIRYRVDGVPSSSSVCYCMQCQRHGGAAMPASVGYPLDRFRLTADTPTGYRASAVATREFCATCGSTLFWRGDGGDKIHIFIGSLDMPSAMPPPQDQIWAAHRLPWVPAIPGLAAYPRGRGSVE